MPDPHTPENPSRCQESPKASFQKNSKSGRLQPPKAWDHYLYARITRVLSLSASRQPETPMLPDPMTGFSPWPLVTLIVALCTVCARKGVINLLNHTLPEAGTSGSTIQVWGLPEQDSIYGRLRRLMFPAVISTTEFPLTISPGQGHYPCLLSLITGHHRVKYGPCPPARPEQEHTPVYSQFMHNRTWNGMHARENMNIYMHACHTSFYMQYLLKVSSMP